MPNVARPPWEHAGSAPNAVALRAGDEVWTYAQLRDASAAFGGELRALGARPGDRVLLVAPTVAEFVVAYLAGQLLGTVVITMNTMATEPEIDYVVEDSGASLLIAWHEASLAASRVAEERDLSFRVLAPGAGARSGTPVDEPVERNLDDTAVLLYTSGTTGRPKGVELTVGNLLDTARTFVEQLDLTSQDRFGTALPLFHVFGQAVCLNTVLTTGASMSLLSPFEPVAMLEMIRRDRLTTVAGVPTMWNAMLHASGDFGPADFADLRLASSGGASLPGEVITAFSDRFGCTILEGYGLTESSGAATYNAPDRQQRIGSVGIPLPGTDVEIRNLDGEPVPAGDVGEVFLRGPSVMKGYWNRPDATAADLAGGWLRTGDLGRVDEDGYLYIVDRAKDLIIRGGYNVYPREVEEVLYEHPDIVEVAVLGVADDAYGEEVAAVVATRSGAPIDEDELRTWAKERLSPYKVPHRFRFVDTLPKGPSGKILKRAIDRDALENPAS
ncbi:AMP-binding protein [Allosaccharopolyspora coralli]|uniref:AMP-binding protein n=1 Tax=Allosaccharopolyspora coralli TaxID=2665642 RepID=A0A5Q3QBM6_9PSEU|nr:long-chain fatty acid--CoA ligase [Allosaccharopolyspora coralli]QGK68999.1 AMP-binding protein [Allosaccharopolyspora coralli]